VDLSQLPGPEVPAPAFQYLADHETTLFGRFEAQELAQAALDGVSK
jgi:hypothetical protein